MVMVGVPRVPYYQGGRAYQPYASGYFGGFGPMDMMFAGLMFGGFGGFDMMGDGLGPWVKASVTASAGSVGGIGDSSVGSTSEPVRRTSLVLN